jgi:DNA mismatch endonuclease (patch repair protein)
MTDVHSEKVRSQNMRAVRNMDTRPELLVRKSLFARGIRYRLNARNLLGKPDLVFPRYQAVIMVHGCFWHGHACHLFLLPSTRTAFWQQKIDSNKSTDIIALEKLHAAGWRVAIVWECALKGRHKSALSLITDQLASWLSDSRTPFLEIAGAESISRA